MKQKHICTNKCVDMSLPNYGADLYENKLKNSMSTDEMRLLDEIATKSLVEDGYLMLVSVH